MTLNTFHFAGRGEMNVTLGIPRLRWEIGLKKLQSLLFGHGPWRPQCCSRGLFRFFGTLIDSGFMFFFFSQGNPDDSKRKHQNADYGHTAEAGEESPEKSETAPATVHTRLPFTGLTLIDHSV